MWEKSYEMTEITNRDSIRVTESVNDAEWADEWVHSMLNYTKWEVDIFAWLTELLDSDRILKNSMQEVSETDNIWDR